MGRLHGSLQKEEAREVGELTGRGLAPETPAVRVAEATGPTVAAECHGEGDHRVHTRWAAREPDGGEPQLVIGAYQLGHGPPGCRQHPHLGTKTGLVGINWNQGLT